jgi:flagellar basal body-associated protein FliL
MLPGKVLLRALLPALALLGWIGCASTPPYDSADCPLYTELGLLKANPAGQLNGHISVEAAFRVCPPEAGLAEIKRKRIELKHEVLALLSSKDAAYLQHPLRIENLRAELHQLANDKIMHKARVEEVLVTQFEYHSD